MYGDMQNYRRNCILGTIAIILAAAVFVGFGAYVGFALRDKPPGHAPTNVFVDKSVYYSADGCWREDGGYWHRMRRCHIVRIPEEQYLRQRYPELYPPAAPNAPTAPVITAPAAPVPLQPAPAAGQQAVLPPPSTQLTYGFGQGGLGVHNPEGGPPNRPQEPGGAPHTTSVPEPATAGLLLLGLGGVWAARRRR